MQQPLEGLALGLWATMEANRDLSKIIDKSFSRVMDKHLVALAPMP